MCGDDADGLPNVGRSATLVAIVEPVGGHGGMNHYDFGLAGGLSTAGVEVVIYTCDETRVPPGLPFKVKPYFTGIYGAAPRLVRAIRFLLCLIRSLMDAHRRGVKVLHFHFFQTTVLEVLCLMLARLSDFRIVVTAHDVESLAGNTSWTIASMVYRNADRVIAHNIVSKTELVNKWAVLPEKVSVVPHGNYADALLADMTKLSARKRLGLPRYVPIVLFFGQIKEVKRLDLLLRALPGVVNHMPQLRLVIAGRVWKDDFSKYQALIDELGLSSAVVTDIRYIPDWEASLYYRAADLVVLPYDKIYQSGVLLAAMSHSTPVLASDLPGMLEIVQDGQTGFVFRAGDSDHLAKRLIEIFACPEKLISVGAVGRRYVQKAHDWEAIGRNMRGIYEAVGSGA